MVADGSSPPAHQFGVEMTTPIDPRRAAGWRRLHFDSIDACAAEVRRILAADQEGRLEALGNWTPGQILAHIAAWIDYAYDGFPVAPPPFPIRWILRWQLPGILAKGMARGVRIPRVPGGTTGMDPIPVAAAAERLLASLRRLASDAPAPHASPAFGPMSDEDRRRLNLRHAELHLGYLTVLPGALPSSSG